MQLPIINQALSALNPTVGNQIAGYSRELEAAAKAKGFKNAEEYVAWQTQQDVRRGNNPTQGKPKPATPPPEPQGAGTFGSILDRISRALSGK